MLSDKSQALIKKLIEKDKKREITWKTTVDSAKYIVEMKDFSITVTRRLPPRIEIDILNQNGLIVEKYRVGERNELWSELDNMYENAHRVALGVDEAVENISNELDSDGIVGGTNEIPF